MRNGVFHKLYKCDVLQGIVNYWYYFLMAFAVAFFATYSIASVNESFSSSDVLRNYFMGVYEMKNNPEFEFPVVFFAYLMVPFMIISFYPSGDFNERAKVIFIRTDKKSYWWYSKCLWLITAVIVYMLMLYVGIIAFSIVFGGEKELWYSSLDCKEIIQYICVPVVTTITLGLAQMAISVAFTPVYGVAFQITVLTLSIVCKSVVLPGNFYMYTRSELCRDDGISIQMTFIVCLIISLCSVIAGRIIVEKKNIL